jgi:hypothetical protein
MAAVKVAWASVAMVKAGKSRSEHPPKMPPGFTVTVDDKGPRN